MVHGVGYIKNVKITSDVKPYYRRWQNMIGRCYDTKNASYKKYGAKGVYVADSWLCFDNFYNDIKLLEGWNEEKFLNSEIQLDKDKKNKGNLLYSRDTCVWLSNEENSRLGYEKQQIPIVAINTEKGIKIITTQRSVAREYNLTLTCVNKCLRGKQKQHKGWKFFYL